VTAIQMGSSWANKRNRLCRIIGYKGDRVVVVWRDTLTHHDFGVRYFLRSFRLVERAPHMEAT